MSIARIENMLEEVSNALKDLKEGQPAPTVNELTIALKELKADVEYLKDMDQQRFKPKQMKRTI